MSSEHLMINEIFYSIQGESTYSGLACLFIRLTGCHLRCHYCDTEYAFKEGRRMSLDAIVQEASRLSDDHCRLYEVTGGEPLLQPAVHPLMSRLADQGHTVLLETSGACPMNTCDPRVIRIMDVKTPSSGEADRHHWPNMEHLGAHDEVKFVIGSREDYLYARQVIRDHDLSERVHAVLMSAVAPVSQGLEILGSQGMSLQDVASWILEDRLPVRLQTQLHKLIWDPQTRGV